MAMVSLKPAVVKWIVDSSGMAHGDLAQKMKVDASIVDEWIRTGRMEYDKIRRLARCVKRSETVFLLKAPPVEEDLHDYRMEGGGAGAIGPEDRIRIRRARYAQSAARDMMGMLGADTRPMISDTTSVDDPPEDVAQRELGRLGMDGVGGGSLDFRRLRDSIEARNILVFQEALDAGAVRGVALTGAVPYAILVNSRDAAESKIFALFHEYGHVLLKKGGICSEQRRPSDGCAGDQKVEAWCNGFAASAIMPSASFAEERGRLEKEYANARAVVVGLAAKFKTSRYAATVRAMNVPGSALGREYAGLLAVTANRFAAKAAKKKAGGGVNGFSSPVDCEISRRGRKFIKLALASYEKKTINSREVIDYLRMDLKHLGELRQKVQTGG